jgi:hypothetical protein
MKRRKHPSRSTNNQSPVARPGFFVCPSFGQALSTSRPGAGRDPSRPALAAQGRRGNITLESKILDVWVPACAGTTRVSVWMVG